MADHMRNRILKVIKESSDLDSLLTQDKAQAYLDKALSRRTKLRYDVRYTGRTSTTALGEQRHMYTYFAADEQTALHVLLVAAHRLEEEVECKGNVVNEWLSLVKKMMGIDTKRALKQRLIAAKVRTRAVSQETRERLRYQYQVREAAKDLAEILEDD